MKIRIPDPDLTIVLPCLNEEGAMAGCLDEIRAMLRTSGIHAEVIVVDNNSTDRSAALARSKAGDFEFFSVIEEKNPGYGFACLAGMRAARGKRIFLADIDRTYDFGEIPLFLAKMRQGADIVTGNRFTPRMERGAMVWHHRYFGTPILTLLARVLFGMKIRDINCGARMISKQAFEKLSLRAGGMEFASEMIIRAKKAGLKIVEIPISYRKRIGESKLETAGDGWRHLRFMLLYSPLATFFVPGIALFAIGTISMVALYSGSLKIFDVSLYFHPMFLSAILMIIGYQTIFFGAFAKTYAATHLGDTDKTLDPLFRHITIEKAGLAGAILAAAGIALYALIFIRWTSSGFGSLDETKNLIAALTLVAIGTQTFFSAFMMSILGIKEK